MTEGKVAFCFPGQGSQEVGMGRAMSEAFPAARDVYERAAEAAGFDVAALCFEGPIERLSETDVTQPALVTTELACLAGLTAAGLTPDYVVGHSVGEYAALAAAGSIDDRTAALPDARARPRDGRRRRGHARRDGGGHRPRRRRGGAALRRHRRRLGRQLQLPRAGRRERHARGRRRVHDRRRERPGRAASSSSRSPAASTARSRPWPPIASPRCSRRRRSRSRACRSSPP